MIVGVYNIYTPNKVIVKMIVHLPIAYSIKKKIHTKPWKPYIYIEYWTMKMKNQGQLKYARQTCSTYYHSYLCIKYSCLTCLVSGISEEHQTRKLNIDQ